MTKKTKILFYDLETSPNIGYTWEKYDQNVISFIKEREILTCAYKFKGDKEVKRDTTMLKIPKAEKIDD